MSPIRRSLLLLCLAAAGCDPTSEWPSKNSGDDEGEAPAPSLDAGVSVGLDAGASRPDVDCSATDGGVSDAGVPADGGCR